MLLRTGLDRFWEAYSDDGGLWREIRPSPIDASSAPGYLLGLQSGRLAPVWNRLYPQGEDSYIRVALPWAERPMSVHREELSLAFSDDAVRGRSRWSSAACARTGSPIRTDGSAPTWSSDVPARSGSSRPTTGPGHRELPWR